MVIENVWCMIEKSTIKKHQSHSHPMFCSEDCRDKFLDNNWNYQV